MLVAFPIACRGHRDTNSFGDLCEVPDEAWIPEEPRLATCDWSARKSSRNPGQRRRKIVHAKRNSVCGFEEILESIDLEQASIGSHLRKPRAGLHVHEGVLGFAGGPMKVGFVVGPMTFRFVDSLTKVRNLVVMPRDTMNCANGFHRRFKLRRKIFEHGSLLQ